MKTITFNRDKQLPIIKIKTPWFGKRLMLFVKKVFRA